MSKFFRTFYLKSITLLLIVLLGSNNSQFSPNAQTLSIKRVIAPRVYQETPKQPSENELKSQAQISEKLEQERLSALGELKIKLEQLQKRNRADLFLIFNERFFTNLLNELTKKKFNAANLFDITVVKSQVLFLNGFALAKLEADLTSTSSLLNITSKLNITAKLLIEQDENNSLVAKFQLVDIQPVSTGENVNTVPLSTQQLGTLLPPITLPLELDFDRTFQPDKFSQTKPIAYELSTEARRVKGRFKIIDFLPLSGRIVLLAKVQDLSITQGQAEGKKKNKPNKPTPTPANFSLKQEPTLPETQTLDKEINNLASSLSSKTDFSVTIKRHFLDLLADEFARSTVRDVIIKVMRSRVISSKSDLGFAKYENYLDIENGDGAVDLKDAEIQNMQSGQITLFVDAVGQIQAQARGKQIGFEYDANPQIGVSLRDQIAFTFEKVGQDFQIKPVPKKISVHLDIRVPVQAIGQDIKTSQNVSIDTTTLIKPVTLPKVINTNLTLPQGKQTITLTDVNYKIENDQMFFGANLTLSEFKEEKAEEK